MCPRYWDFPGNEGILLGLAHARILEQTPPPYEVDTLTTHIYAIVFNGHTKLFSWNLKKARRVESFDELSLFYSLISSSE